MPVVRKILLLALALVLLVPACGGDDDDNQASTDTTAEKKTTTTAGDDADEHESDDEATLDDDAYAKVFAKSLVSSDTGFGMTESEAQCATDKVLDEIDAQRLQEAGMTRQRLNSSAGTPTDLTDEEARTIVDALFECADMGEAFARQVAGGLEGEENISAEQAQCFGDAVGDDESIRELMALSLQNGDDAAIPHDNAEHLVDLMMGCFDFAELLVSGFEEAGLTVTPEQRQCLSDQLKDSDAFRDAMIAEFSGAPVDDDEGTQLFLDLATKCDIDLFSAETGITS